MYLYIMHKHSVYHDEIYVQCARTRVSLMHPSCFIHLKRGSNISTDLLNELRKSNQMQGLSSILSLFYIEFDKFNNTRA